MSKITAEFNDRNFFPVIVNPALDVAPATWTADTAGGPATAEIEVRGSRYDLLGLRQWLRYAVVIRSPKGTPVWWGYISEVEIQVDGLKLGASLDDYANRISLLYSSIQAESYAAAQTDWVQDDAEVDEFGTKEILPSIGKASQTRAEQERDNLLAHSLTNKGAVLRSIGSSGENKVTLHCRGWFATIGWKYYQRTDGRVEHVPASNVKQQPVGWGFSGSSLIGFGGQALHDANTTGGSGRLDALSVGHKITVSGADTGSNNKTYTVTAATTEEVETYTAGTISFEVTDDILDSAEGMGMIEADHWVLVDGSDDNDGWYYITSAGPDHIVVNSSLDTIVNEAAGDTITLTQAQRLSVLEATAFEAPGAGSISITFRGYEVAQSAVIGTTMRVNQVQLFIGKYASPSDALTVEVYSNSSGAPGSLLSSGSLAAASVPEEITATWVPISEITLSAGTYWIVVKRSSSLDPHNHYWLGMTETAYGTCLQYTGSGWEAHAPGWYVKFRLWANEDTATIATTMLLGAEFVEVSGDFESGVDDFPTMDELRRMDDVLETLMASGTANDKRILMFVSPERLLTFVEQPTTTELLPLVIDSDGDGAILRDGLGGDIDPGLLPVGQWASIAALEADEYATSSLTPIFIDEATYKASTGRWDIQPVSRRDLAGALRVRRG